MRRQSPQDRRSVSGSGDKSPVVAMLLGIIPGLGAAYNGQNIKALVHFAVIVGMWQMADVLAPGFFFAVAGVALYLYSIYDARRSALRLRRGEDLSEEDGRLRSFLREHTLLWGAALVVVGLLSILNVYTAEDYWLWPLLLVAAGCVLYGRFRSGRETPRTPFVTPPPSVISVLTARPEIALEPIWPILEGMIAGFDGPDFQTDWHSDDYRDDCSRYRQVPNTADSLLYAHWIDQAPDLSRLCRTARVYSLPADSIK
jgi:TM2 domain-containing membrane protein YozV